LGHNAVFRIVGQVNFYQLVSVSDYEERFKIEEACEHFKVLSDSVVQHPFLSFFSTVF